MAAVAISDSNNRVDAAEATTNWSKIGNSLAQEPDFVWQGSFAVSSKVGTTAGGHSCAPGAVDMTTGDNQVCLFKALWSNYSVLTSNPAALHRIGSSSSAYYEYYIADDGTQGDIDYPPRGGWLITPINPNVTAWRDGVTGSPNLASVNYFATVGDFTATSKSENVVTDALDLGDGLYLVGGDGGDADGTFADFRDDDEGEPTNGRFGHVTSIEGIFYVFGKLVVGRTAGGTVTATEFTSTPGRTVVFPGGRVAAGWNLLEFDIGNASTVVTLSNLTVVGRGRNALKRFFDSSADEVNGGTEVITISGFADHGFQTGDAVLYSAEGGTAISDLTNSTEYFVRRLSATTLSLHTTRQGAYGNTGVRNLTAAGTGQHHSLTRQPATRPDITVVGTSGTFDAIACTFLECRNITLTSAAELDGCVLLACSNLTMAQGLITDCQIIDPLVAEGVAFCVTPDLGDISGCSFEFSEEGHAIEITAAGTYSFVGNTFTGYGPSKASFNASSGVDGGTEVITTDAAHGFSDGDPVYYGDEGGTPIGGLTDGDRYYVNSITSTTLSLHVTRADAVADANRVNLTAGSSETHYLYSGRSAILNSSGGLVTINVSGGGDSPSVRNTPGSTTVVSNPVTHTVTNLRTNDRVIWIRQSDGAELENLVESGGSAAYQYEYVSDTPVWVQVLSGDNTKKNTVTSVTLGNTDAGFPAVQADDRVYANP